MDTMNDMPTATQVLLSNLQDSQAEAHGHLAEAEAHLAEAHAALSNLAVVLGKMMGIREAIDTIRGCEPVLVHGMAGTATLGGAGEPARQRQPVQQTVLDILSRSFSAGGMTAENIILAAQSGLKLTLPVKSVRAALARLGEAGRSTDKGDGKFARPIPDAPEPPAESEDGGKPGAVVE